MARSQWAGLVVSLAVAITVAGCSGGNEPSGIYKSADVDRLVEIAPVTPGWPPWPQKPEQKRAATESPKQLAASDPIYAEYRRRTAAIEQSDNWASDNRWQQDDDKLAHLAVAVLDTSTDAHMVFAADNDASRAYGAEYGVVDKAEKVDGLGDEAWRLWAHGNGSQVTYHWRRDNLVFEVHIHCHSDCPDTDAAVDAAARAWADAIDERARSERG